MQRNFLNLEELKLLLSKGHTTAQIARIMQKSHGTIYSAIKRQGLKSNDKQRVRISKELVVKYANEGMSCAEISREIGFKVDGVYAILKRNNIDFFNGKFNRDKELTFLEKSVILGTLYGDSSITLSGKNPFLSGGHCIKQMEYCKWKISLITSIEINSYRYSPRPDKRTGKIYEVFGFKSESNSCFHEFKQLSYINGIKIISKELLDKYYNELSLAIHFMDDGSRKRGNTKNAKPTYSIATMGFDENSVTIFREFLYNKWGIETTMYASKVMAIKVRSNELFLNLISKYIHKDMMYKL